MGNHRAKPKPEKTNAEDDFKKAIEERDYITDGVWELYKPHFQEENDNGDSSFVKILYIHLLSSQKEVTENVEADSLINYVKGITGRITRAFSENKNPFELLMECTLHTADHPDCRIATRGEVDREKIRELISEVQTVDPLFTKKGDILFRLQFRVFPDE
jgi:hypothetical protein